MKTTAMNKIRKNTFAALVCLSLLATAFTSCDVHEQLCEAEHPHKGWAQFKYSWDRLPENYQQYIGKIIKTKTDERYYLDSMYIIGDRVINQKVSYYGFSTRNNDGCYKSELPSVWVTNENGELEYRTYVKDNEHITDFYIPAGEYKFLSVNMDAADYKYEGLSNLNEATRNVHLGDVTLENLTYEGNSEYIVHPKEWTSETTTFDRNQYSYDGEPALFIRNSQEPVVVDSTTIMKWGADENKTVEFHPVPVTQNIDVFFDLKKDGSVQFKVDSVWCIMSGIPHRMNVGTGGLDVSRTDKIMFRTYFVNTNTVPTYNSERLTDEVGNVNLRCHANITVPGIVENTVTDANTYIGPGVMQIIIYTTITDETYTGPKEEKILMGMVNLHKSLKAAKLQTFDTDRNVWKKSRDHTSLYLSFDGSVTREMLYGSNVGGIIPFEEKEVPDQFILY